MPGITYTLTDRFGTTHERFSSGHLVPNYPFAVVRYNMGPIGREKAFSSPGKAGVSYHGSRHLADTEAGRIQLMHAKFGRPCLVDVLPTVATPGRARPTVKA